MPISYLKGHIWSLGNQPYLPHSSLIICTFKRPDTIFRLLEALSLQSGVPDEILVVDGSQEETTLKVIEKFVASTKLSSVVIYIQAPTGLTLQRNAGIDISKGEIIHFLDDDCIPFQGYFKEIEEVFNNNPGVGGVTGAILNEMNAPLSLKFKIRRFLGLYAHNGIPGKYYCNGSSVPKPLLGLNVNTDYDIDVVSGASMSFRRSVINEVDGFSEFFSGYSQGEDLEFSLRIRQKSRILFCRKAECNHYHEQSSRPDLYKKGFMEIYNRHYIWRINFKKCSLKCLYQFWGDIFFINIYSLFAYFLSGFRKQYFNYCIGLFWGTIKSIVDSNPVSSGRTQFFKLATPL